MPLAPLYPLRYTLLMRNPRAIFLFLLIALITISAFFVLRARGENVETGPPIALCPGPDQYGYQCQSGAEFVYIDATNDTGLYEDDGTILVDLPFAFTFYGRSYQQIALSSNGTLQFTTENPAFANECLNNGPVQGMGEMIAPYWDDLDLTFSGFLETAVTGDSGSQIFTIEWDDIPPFGSSGDTVTFEVQLHEGSNDLVFLYQDVTRTQGNLGGSATVGLQSETLGNTLQHGCDQLVLTNGQKIYFPHPAVDIGELSPSFIRQSSQPFLGSYSTFPIPKGDMNLILERLNLEGLNGIDRMDGYWMGQGRPKIVKTQSFDLTGNGQNELVVLLRAPIAFASETQIAVFSMVTGEAGESWRLLYHDFPLARQEGDSKLVGRFYSSDPTTNLLDLLPAFENE